MLDMGFIHDIKKVLAVLPQKKQSLLFSATFSDEVKAIADRLLNAPVLIEVARRNQTAELIAQKVHPVGREMKKDLLVHLVKEQRLAPGAGLHAHEARRQPPGRAPAEARHHGDGDPRQQEPDGAHQGARRLQEGRPAGAGRDRHRRPRHRHRPAAARRQLRAAERARGLRAPDRPHRPRRHQGRGDLARLRRRERVPARHRAADQERDPEGDRSRLRAAGARAARADRARPHGDRRRRRPRRHAPLVGRASRRFARRLARRQRQWRQRAAVTPATAPAQQRRHTAAAAATAATPAARIARRRRGRRARRATAARAAVAAAVRRPGWSRPSAEDSARPASTSRWRRKPRCVAPCSPGPPAWSAGRCCRCCCAVTRRSTCCCAAPRPSSAPIRACARTSSTSPGSPTAVPAGRRRLHRPRHDHRRRRLRGGVSRRRLRCRRRDRARRACRRRDPARARLGARRRRRLARLLQPGQGRDRGGRRRRSATPRSRSPGLRSCSATAKRSASRCGAWKRWRCAFPGR